MPNVQFFAKGQAAAYTIFETLKRQPAIDVNDPSGEKLEGGAVRGEITLTDVHFAYPARPDAPIFQVRMMDAGIAHASKQWQEKQCRRNNDTH